MSVDYIPLERHSAVYQKLPFNTLLSLHCAVSTLTARSDVVSLTTQMNQQSELLGVSLHIPLKITGTARKFLAMGVNSTPILTQFPSIFHNQIQSNLGSRTPWIMNNSVYEQIFRTQSVSDDVLCLELRTRKPSTSRSDKLGVSFFFPVALQPYRALADRAAAAGQRS